VVGRRAGGPRRRARPRADGSQRAGKMVARLLRVDAGGGRRCRTVSGGQTCPLPPRARWSAGPAGKRPATRRRSTPEPPPGTGGGGRTVDDGGDLRAQVVLATLLARPSHERAAGGLGGMRREQLAELGLADRPVHAVAALQ